MLLNWAARYFPILRVLRQNLREGELILEVGSGSFGLSAFYPHAFVGCDVEFPCRPKRPMLPVRSSGIQLPFRDEAFAAVIASDVLEHVPPDSRTAVIQECLRVTRNLAILGFPCGNQAYKLDQGLFEDYRARGLPPPQWLEEHMQFPFPDASLFESLPDGWVAKSFGNESLAFHRWVMLRELSLYWRILFRAGLILAPRIAERAIARAEREPFYRQIFVVSRVSPNGGATS